MGREQPLELNKIVTDPEYHEAFLSSVWEATIKKRSFWTNDIRYILPAMVQECAHEVIVPAHGAATDWEAETPIELLPVEMKARIKIVDRKNKIWKRVTKFFDPVSDELDKRDTELFSHHDFSRLIFEEKLFLVLRSFYFLLLASREEAEADIWATGVKKEIQAMKNMLKSDEALFRLDQFYGLLNLYTGRKIPCVKYIAKELNPSVEERLNELLHEAEIIEMSKHKRLLGFASLHPRLIWLKLSNSLRKVARRKKYKTVAEIGDEVIRVIGKLGYPLPNLPTTIDINRYNPPLVDLKPLRFKIFNQQARARFRQIQKNRR